MCLCVSVRVLCVACVYACVCLCVCCVLRVCMPVCVCACVHVGASVCGVVPQCVVWCHSLMALCEGFQIVWHCVKVFKSYGIV